MNALRSELIKLRRPPVLIGAVGTMVLITLLATLLAFAVGGGDTTFNGGRPSSLELSTAALESTSGATRGFELGAGFGGVVFLMAFAVSVASEFSGGTIRTLLLAEPRRVRLLAGKLAGLMVLVAVGYAVAVVGSVLVAVVCANIKGISISEWFTASGFGEMAKSYGEAVLAGIGWGLFGAAVALILRSVIASLAVVLVWFFPLENILHNGWSGSDTWFPGLLLQGLHPNSGAPIDAWRAVLTLAAYLTVALGIAAVTFTRRDVTA